MAEAGSNPGLTVEPEPLRLPIYYRSPRATQAQPGFGHKGHPLGTKASSPSTQVSSLAAPSQSGLAGLRAIPQVRQATGAVRQAEDLSWWSSPIGPGGSSFGFGAQSLPGELRFPWVRRSWMVLGLVSHLK